MMYKQESTYDKETFKLTSFTEYLDGSLLVKHYYNEDGDVCRFERKGYSGETKWSEPINDSLYYKKVIFYKDSLGGFIEEKPVKEGYINVHINVMVSKTPTSFESIYNDLSTVDDIIEKYPISHYELTITLFTDENMNKRLLLIRAIKESINDKFRLFEYVENIKHDGNPIDSIFKNKEYKISDSIRFKTTVNKELFIQNASLLHYLDEYNIELPND